MWEKSCLFGTQQRSAAMYLCRPAKLFDSKSSAWRRWERWLDVWARRKEHVNQSETHTHEHTQSLPLSYIISYKYPHQQGPRFPYHTHTHANNYAWTVFRYNHTGSWLNFCRLNSLKKMFTIINHLQPEIRLLQSTTSHLFLEHYITQRWALAHIQPERLPLKKTGR